jgi:RHS repeat-associated protein
MTATPSGANLTGGANGTPATYDSGTAWVAVNGFQASAGYGQGSTTATVASAIASVFNNSGSSPVTASVSGAALTLTSKQTGAGTNYALTSGSSTNQPGTFSQPSFSVSVANLTGGKNAGTAPGTIYNYNVAYAPNGDVLSGNDTVNGTWTYAYDAFNRLLTAASSNTGLGCSWVYDRFGNRLQQNPYNGSCGGPQYTSSGGNNRMDGYSYDAAGNLLNDGSNNYSYDAENRISQVGPAGSTATYGYDAAGQRVRKTSSAGTVDYIYDLAGHEIAEVSSAGALNRGEVYAGGRHLATYDGGTTYFNHVDWLGTERARSNVSGMQCEAVVSLPFGDGTSVTSSCVPPDPSPMHFTGKQRDSETNLDYFGARYYGSNMGRFMSPDWDEDPAPVPYADLRNPQSLNLYSYVQNNPLRNTDDDGHECHQNADGSIVCNVVLNPPPPPPAAQANTIPWYWPVITGGVATIPKAIRIGGVIGLTLGYLMDPPYQYAKDTVSVPDESQKYKVPKPGVSGKEGAKDVPSWAEGARPKAGESGKEFAKRLCEQKYGKGNYDKGPGSDFNKIKKWGDRSFQDPPPRK